MIALVPIEVRAVFTRGIPVLLGSILIANVCDARSPKQRDEIVLQGMLFPSDVSATISAVCFGMNFTMDVSHDSAGNAQLKRFLVNGKNSIDSQSAISAGNKIASLKRPYFSGISCLEKGKIIISLSSANIISVEKDYEISFIELSI